MKLVAAIAAAALLVAVIALAISVHRGPDPIATPAPAAPSAPTTITIAPDLPTATYVAPSGIAAARIGAGPRYPVPTGGFARFTGREGAGSGEVEAFAEEAGLRVTVALEQRRSVVLLERTSDLAALTGVLGAPPTDAMIAGIRRSATTLHEIVANVQAQSRAGAMSEDDAIEQTRAAEDAYRAAYLAATGLDQARFDQLFAP